MSTSVIIVIVMAVVAILVIVLASQRSGPRVTHIETHRTSEDRKDGDDA